MLNKTSREFNILEKYISKSHLNNSDEYIITTLTNLAQELNNKNLTYIGSYALKKTFEDSITKHKRFKQYIKKNEAINNINIPDPIFIMGMPRSGTTYIHNLIIKSTDYEGLKFWELCEPIPYYQNKKKDIFIRKLKTNIIYYLFKIFVSNIQKMHPVWVDSYEECWHLFKLNMNIYNLDFQLDLNFFGDYIFKENGYNAYNDYALLLKILTLEKENKKLVLKCPEHFLFTNHLKKLFPKSKFIWMHRDPGRTICSYSKMIYEVQKFYYGKKNIKKSEVGNFIKNKFYEMLKTGLKIRENNENDFIDVNYINLINDTKQTLNYISTKCDFEIKNINLLNTRNKKLNKLKNKTNYSFDEFNLNRIDINDLFKSYLEKFNIKIEY